MVVFLKAYQWLLHCPFIGGSLFLFDRKVLRYFRKDGHSWRKKKDGKTVREAHEKLKVCGFHFRQVMANYIGLRAWWCFLLLLHIFMIYLRPDY